MTDARIDTETELVPRAWAEEWRARCGGAMAEAERLKNERDEWKGVYNDEADRCVSLAAERDRLASALKAEQHAHTETASGWHARFVKADQDRMALKAERTRLESEIALYRAALERIERVSQSPETINRTVGDIASDALNGATHDASTATHG